MLTKSQKNLPGSVLPQHLDKEIQSVKSHSKSSTNGGSPTSQRRINGSRMALDLSFLVSLVEEMQKRVASDLGFLNNHTAEIEKLNNTKNISDPELRMIKILINFNAYTLQNRLTEPTFHTPNQIIYRFKTMKSVLEVMASCLKHRLVNTKIYFSDEKECFQAFQDIFTDNLFKQPCFRRVCSEIYRFVRDERANKPSEMFYKRFHESIKIFLFGISLPSDNTADYPLHHAIYNSDIEQVYKLCEGTQTDCFYAHVEQADLMGLSALMLAIKLKRQEIVKILVEKGADPRHKAIPKSRFPIEEAMTLKDKDIIRTLLIASYQLRLNRWEKTKQEVMNLLESIPDFSFELHWECDSNYIPFVSKIAPSDTNKISKKGSSLRMDATIAGINGIKVVRGNISLFLLGKDHPGYEGQLLMVNHGKKTVTNLMTEIDLKRLEKQVDYVAKQDSLPNDIKPEDVQFEPAKSWRGELVTEKIQNYQTVKYSAKGTLSLIYTKKANEDVAKFSSFEKYFEACFRTRFWAPTSFDDISPFDQLVAYVNADSQLSKKLFESGFNEENKKHELVSKFESMKNAQNKQLKETKKQIDASIWLTDNFPLHFEHLIAILDILSSASPNISKLKEFLEKKSILHNRSFPLKAVIPIYLSVTAVINFQNFVFKTPDSTLFEVPKSKELIPSPQTMKISATPEKNVKFDGFSTPQKSSERIQNEIFGSKKVPSSIIMDVGNDSIQFEVENISSRVLSEQISNESRSQTKDADAPVTISFRMERYSLHSKKRSNGQTPLSAKKLNIEFDPQRDYESKVRSEPTSCSKEFKWKDETTFSENFSRFRPQEAQEIGALHQISDVIVLEKQKIQNLFPLSLGKDSLINLDMSTIDLGSVPTEYQSVESGGISSKFVLPTPRSRREKPGISID